MKLNWPFLRKEIVYTLSLFKYLLNKSSCTVEIKRAIVNELKYLLLSINRVSNLPELIFYELFSATTNRNGTTSQLFHLHLDIWWNTYQIFKYVDPILKDDICLIRDKTFASTDLLNQFRNLFLSDLISISLIKFNINHLDANYRHLDAFSCGCIKLIYVFIYLDYQLNVQNDNLQQMINPFWNDFNKILDVIFNSNDKTEEFQLESIKHFQWINKNKKLDKKNGQFASLWLISSLADLFQTINMKEFDDLKLKNFKSIENIEFQNNLYVCNIIRSLIKFEDKNEIDVVQLLNILKLCFKLSKSWNLSIEIVLIFFDFFMKNLDTPFQLNSNIKNLQMLPKSGFIWYQMLTNLDVELSNLDNEENVNQMFYFLIYNFVKKSVDDHSANNYFQKFKGRLYSKLQAKKIEEFKEIGLYNLLNTFMVTSFASKNNSIDLLNKFLFVVKVVKNKNLYNARMLLIFKSLFCFNYFLTKTEDLIKVNEMIVELFNEICHSIPNWSLNNIQISSVHNSYFELVNLFFSEILEYLKNEKNPNLTFCNVLKCKFNLLLPKLSEREVLLMLKFINNLINEIKFKLENDEFNCDLSFYTNVHQLMSDQFMDFLKTQMQSKSSNPQVPEIVKEYIYITILLSTNEQNFKNLIDNFLFNKFSNTSNLCELIIKIVDCDTIFSKFLDVYYCHNLETKMMELWFQIIITNRLPNEKFDRLTKQLAVQFPIFKSSNSGLLAVQDVFVNVNNKYQASKNQDKAKLCSEFNQSLIEMINQGKYILKDENTNEDSFNQLYTILSYLVLNCCPMIYAQGNSNMILPQILETFLNPNFIQNLPAVKAQFINSCIRKIFAKVLIGLTSLYKLNDAYIDRRLKLMFITYVPLFQTKNSTHPILVELNQNRTANSELFSLIFHYLKDCLFIRTSPNPALTMQLIQFTNEFYSTVRNNPDQRIQLFKLFPLFLDKMLVSEELTKRKIRDLLTLIVNCGKEQIGEVNLSKNLTEFYEEFIKKNSCNLVKVIKILEFTLPFCLLIREKLISILMYLIKQIEDSSSGTDDLLRACFQQFVNKMSS